MASDSTPQFWTPQTSVDGGWFGPGDGCTLWFDGAWRQCCDAHDVAYSIGADKWTADVELASCVAQTGHAGMGLIMLLVLSGFGWIFYRRARR